jgi:hypothetical protein
MVGLAWIAGNGASGMAAAHQPHVITKTPRLETLFWPLLQADGSHKYVHWPNFIHEALVEMEGSEVAMAEEMAGWCVVALHRKHCFRQMWYIY